MLTPTDMQNLTSRDAVSYFFRTELNYQVNPVPFDAGELGIPDAPAQFIREIEQLCNYQHQFQVYFMQVNSLRRTDLRAILEPFYRKHPVGNYLFIFTKDYDEIAFVSPLRLTREDDATKTKLYLRSLRVDRSNVYHTDLETLDGIRLLWGEGIPSIIWEKHKEAFNVERVTRDFFTTYSAVFDEVKRSITGIPDANERHLFTQILFNRLLFCWFLQKKGWLNHEPDYFLRRLTRAKERNENFFDDVLYWLFFWMRNMPIDSGMIKPGQYALHRLIGDVPFLNGGLFEMSKWDVRGEVQIPNGVFDNIFRRLFSRYNFTVEESTPLDVRVAVDPEMLGKVFEELVIERHAQGSYYTPRDVVSFMCRESLKAYLTEQLNNPLTISPTTSCNAHTLKRVAVGGQCPPYKSTSATGAEPVPIIREGCGKEDKADAITALVDARDVSGLSIADGEKPMELMAGFVPLEMICFVSVGMVLNADEKQAQGQFVAADLLSVMQDAKHPKAYAAGKDLVKWHIEQRYFLEYGTKRVPGMIRRPTFPQLYDVPMKLLAAGVTGDIPKVAFDEQRLYHNHSIIAFVPWHSLKGVVNKSISKTATYRRQSPDGDREEREKLSQQFNLKYVLAIMNSTFAKDWLAKKRRSKMSIYPDDWKQLPIPPLSLEE